MCVCVCVCRELREQRDVDVQQQSTRLRLQGLLRVSQSHIAIKLTISVNTLTIAPTAEILTYNDRTVTHLHIKWGVSVGPTVIGAGT